MKKYSGNKSGMHSEKMVKDYQPSNKEFAGEMMGKANMYMERTDKRMNKDAGKIRSQAYKGRYD